MPPAMPIPPGSAITAPWGVFEFLLLVTFAAHLLAMNAALGGTLLALFTPGRDRGPAGFLARRLPTSVAVTVNLGVPPLLFASVLYGQYLYTAAILSAVTWLSLFMVVMLAYALLYAFQSRAARPGSGLIVAVAAMLLLSASLILVNVSTLSVRPDVWGAYFDQPGGGILNVGDPTFVPRWLHFVAASLAVGGLFLALSSRKAAAAGDSDAAGRMRLGLGWFVWATVSQAPVGLWFLVSLPGEVMGRFLGGDELATSALGLALILAGAALYKGVCGSVGSAVWLTAATVLGMAFVRELVRRATLAKQFAPESLPVAVQLGPMAMFAASALVAGAGIVWVVRVYRNAGPAGRS